MTTEKLDTDTKIRDAVAAWFEQHIKGSVLGEHTESYNHLVQRLPELKGMLSRALNPVREVTQSERDTASGSSVGAKKP